MLILILTFASLIIRGTSSCVPTLRWNSDENITNIVSSSATLYSDNSSPSSSDSSYDIPIQNAQDYSIAAGISYMGQYYDPKRLSFALNILKDQSKFTVTFITSDSANWTSVAIHYMASKRFDIIIGNALIQSDSIPKDEQTYSFNVKQPYSSKKNYKNNDIDSFTFVTGINSSNRFLQVYTQKATFSQDKKIVFNVNLKNRVNTEILYLQFGYIIYQVQQTYVKISNIGDSLLKQFEINHLEIDKNQFIGMTSIVVKQLTNFRRRFLSSVVLSKPAYIQSFYKGFRIRGVVLQGLLGNAPTLNDDGVGMKLGDTCQNYKDCQKNGGILSEVDGILSCIKCRENSAYSPVQKLCKCNIGYYRNDKICIPQQTLARRLQDVMNCTLAQIHLPQCMCPLPGQFLNFRNQKCECKPGYKEYNISSEIRCISCPTNQQFDIKQQKCYCPTGIYQNGVCCVCTDPLTIMNILTKECDCIPGTDKFGERCAYCPSNSIYSENSKKCQCKQGFLRVNMNVCQIKSSSTSQVIDFSVLAFRSGFVDETNNIRRV